MRYLRNCWYMACWLGELEPGGQLARRLLGRPLLLVRDLDGGYHAFDDRCPHRSAPLSLGRFDGEAISCGYHGLQFGLTGACTRNPHPWGRISPALALRSYPVIQKHKALWIWMGDAEADPALIPDFSTLDEGYITRPDHIVMPAPYDLLIDNLLDCSHTSFLHEGILGNADMIAAPTEVRQSGTTINVVRFSRNVAPPGMLDAVFRNDAAPVDTWTDFRWDAPSCLLLDFGVTTPGAPREEGTGYFGIHILTPETDATTHYFTTACRWNVRAEFETDETRQRIADMRRFAFEEQDGPMIAGQLANLRAFPAEDTRPIMIETDVGVARWRRIIDKMMTAEEDAARASADA